MDVGCSCFLGGRKKEMKYGIERRKIPCKNGLLISPRFFNQHQFFALFPSLRHSMPPFFFASLRHSMAPLPRFREKEKWGEKRGFDRVLEVFDSLLRGRCPLWAEGQEINGVILSSPPSQERNDGLTLVLTEDEKET
jgi:hypothetical protein